MGFKLCDCLSVAPIQYHSLRSGTGPPARDGGLKMELRKKFLEAQSSSIAPYAKFFCQMG